MIWPTWFARQHGDLELQNAISVHGAGEDVRARAFSLNTRP
jgi:hypothetical protein